MRFGINTFLFTSPFTTRSTKLFGKFKKWGFDTVELAIEEPAHIDPKKVKAELDKAGIACGSACACLGPDRDLRGDAKQQKNAMKYMTAVLDQMVVLDCPTLIGPRLFIRRPRGCGARPRTQAAMAHGREELEGALPVR